MSFSGSLLSGTSLSGGQYYGAGLSVLGEWTPYQLFARNEIGAWYDPSDLTTLYQDSAGTTPVTTAGQVVGLMLDKSRGLALGAELVTNGTFATDTTGWTAARGNGTLSVVSGRCRITSTAGSNEVASQALTNLTIGRTYKITSNLYAGTSTTAYIRVSAVDNLGTAIAERLTTGVDIFAQFVFVATATTLYVGALNVANGAGTYCEFDNISVRELPGNHATQSGATSVRPIYAVEPATGRRNLLTYTEDLGNAAWASTLTSRTLDANTNFWELFDNSAESALTITAPIVALPINSTVSFSFYLRKDTVFAVTPIVSVGFTGGTAQNYRVQIQPVTGQTSNQVVTAAGTTTVTSVSDTEWFVEITATDTGANTQCSVVITPAGNDGFPRAGVAATPVGSAGIKFPQLETGSTATAYQRVVSQYDVTESGVASRHYLAFDGIDDWLQTSTITPGTDKAQVFAGVRKLSDAAAGTVFDLNGATATGAVMLRAPAGPTATYAFYSGGSIAFVGAVTSASFASPASAVLTGIGDIAADTQIIRVNGAQAATSAADQGTGNYSALPIYIGRRQGTSVPFNGNLYGLIVRFGANLTAAQISNAERWMNGKTRAY